MPGTGNPTLAVPAVGLLYAYLNHGDLLHDLGELTRQLDNALVRSQPPATRSVSTVAPGFRQRRLTDRLDDAQVQAIVSAFEGGIPRQLAGQYASVSVVSGGCCGSAEWSGVFRPSPHPPIPQPLIKRPNRSSMLPGLQASPGLYHPPSQPNRTVPRRNLSGIPKQPRRFIDLVALHIRLTEVNDRHSYTSSA
jgi:hypothetical protein